MKKIFIFFITFFIFTSVGCGAVSWNQKKSWPKAPTMQELRERRVEIHQTKLAKNPTSNTVQDDTLSTLKVYLKPSMVELCPDQQKQVLNWLKTIENFKKQNYIITGYADNSIDKKGKKDNHQYSLERAANGKIFLVKQGIPTLNIQYFGGGADPANISQGKKRRIEIRVLRKFDPDIPLIPLPPEPAQIPSVFDNQIFSMAESARYPDWNNFPDGYSTRQCGVIYIGWKKIDNNTFDIIISVHESLIPEGATQFMPLGISEGWTKGTSVWPTPMWRETLSPQSAMFRRNIVCRDKNNRDLGYANINQAQRAGSCWAVKNSEIGMEKNKQDNSSCIGFFLTSRGVQPVFSN